MAFASVLEAAGANAARVLSEMAGRPASLTATVLEKRPLAAVADLAGSAEEPVLGIYLLIQGDARGSILFLWDRRSAWRLASHLLGEPVPAGEPDRSLEGLHLSALQEVGNLCGSAFLNAMADSRGLSLQPTPPLLGTDMAGALIGGAIAELGLAEDQVPVVRTRFSVGEERLEGLMLVLFPPAQLSLLA